MQKLRQDIHVADLFRMEKDAERLRARHGSLPGSWVPPGGASTNYRILWDKELTQVDAIHAKYGTIRGFAGPVVTQAGSGARFCAHHYNAAREEAGLPTGFVYWVHGVPVEYDEQDVPKLLAAANWKVEVVANAKSVRGQVMQVKIRAKTEMPMPVIKIRTQAEIVTLQIREHNANSMKMPEKSKEGPQTWAQVIRSSLGKELTTHEDSKEHDGRQRGPPKRKEPPPANDFNMQVDWETMNIFDQSFDEEDDEAWCEEEEDQCAGSGDAQPVDVEDDKFIEQNPRLKRYYKGHKQKLIGQGRTKWLKLLEEGLMSMQAQMGFLRLRCLTRVKELCHGRQEWSYPLPVDVPSQEVATAYSMRP